MRPILAHPRTGRRRSRSPRPGRRRNRGRSNHHGLSCGRWQSGSQASRASPWAAQSQLLRKSAAITLIRFLSCLGTLAVSHSSCVLSRSRGRGTGPDFAARHVRACLPKATYRCSGPAGGTCSGRRRRPETPGLRRLSGETASFSRPPRTAVRPATCCLSTLGQEGSCGTGTFSISRSL